MGIKESHNDRQYIKNIVRGIVNERIEAGKHIDVNFIVEEALGSRQDDGRYLFVHTCVDSTSEDIDAMKEQAQDVSIRTFKRKIGTAQYKELEQSLGPYDRSFRLADDWAVGAYQSVYRGVPAYYLVWSGIEHIYTLDGKLG